MCKPTRWQVFRNTIWNGFVRLSQFIGFHFRRITPGRAVAAAMMIVGWGMLLNPRFAFQGDLYAVSATAPVVYGLIFLASGINLFFRHRRRLFVFLLSTPLLFHLLVNIIDIALTGYRQATPVMGLYLLLTYFLYRLYGGKGAP